VAGDAVAVVVEEAEEDALKQGGTSSEELLYRDQAFSIARIRLPWLIVTLMGSLVSAKMIHLYSGVLSEAIILAAFIAFDGESTWLEGASLVALYGIIATAFWWG
jgi:Mg/Co/Ni transporter MgtE